MRPTISVLRIGLKCGSVYPVSSCTPLRILLELVWSVNVVLVEFGLFRDLERRFWPQHVSAVALYHLLVILVVEDLVRLIVVILAFARALSLPLVRAYIATIHSTLRSTQRIRCRSVVSKLFWPCEPAWVVAVLGSLYVWALVCFIAGDFLSSRRSCLLLVNL